MTAVLQYEFSMIVTCTSKHREGCEPQKQGIKCDTLINDMHVCMCAYERVFAEDVGKVKCLSFCINIPAISSAGLCKMRLVFVLTPSPWHLLKHNATLGCKYTKRSLVPPWLLCNHDKHEAVICDCIWLWWVEINLAWAASFCHCCGWGIGFMWINSLVVIVSLQQVAVILA